MQASDEHTDEHTTWSHLVSSIHVCLRPELIALSIATNLQWNVEFDNRRAC